MFYMIRIVLIFVFGAGMTQMIEESAVGGFLMGLIALTLTVWMIMDIARYLN